MRTLPHSQQSGLILHYGYKSCFCEICLFWVRCRKCDVDCSGVWLVLVLLPAVETPDCTEGSQMWRSNLTEVTTRNLWWLFLIPLMIVNDLWQIRDHVCARVWSQVKYNTTSHHESFCGLSVTCRHHKLAKAFTTAGVITCLSKGGARNNNSWKVLCRHLNLSFYPITPALYCRVTWKSFWASGTLFLSCLAELLKARPARNGTFWNHKRKRKTHKAQF